MTDQTDKPCWPKPFLYSVVALLALYSASANLQEYLYLPAVVWFAGGGMIAGVWAYEKFCRFEKMDNGSHDCSACGVFGHKLPWVLLVTCGLASLTDLSMEWSAFSAYAIAVALFSLAGSSFMMWLSEDKPVEHPLS